MSEPGFYCQRNTRVSSFCSKFRTLCTKTALSLPWHLTLFSTSRPATHTALHCKNGLLIQVCSLALSCYTYTTALCCRYMETLRAAIEVFRKLGLVVPQLSLLLSFWEWFRSVSVSEVIVLCETNSWEVIKVLWFTKHICKYLLDSALTLSISLRRVTSRSIKLEKKKRVGGGGSFTSRGNLENADSALLSNSNDYKTKRQLQTQGSETQKHHWMTMQDSKQYNEHNYSCHD